jgi:hypothetical protein
MVHMIAILGSQESFRRITLLHFCNQEEKQVESVDKVGQTLKCEMFGRQGIKCQLLNL